MARKWRISCIARLSNDVLIYHSVHNISFGLAYPLPTQTRGPTGKGVELSVTEHKLELNELGFSQENDIMVSNFLLNDTSFISHR